MLIMDSKNKQCTADSPAEVSIPCCLIVHRRLQCTSRHSGRHSEPGAGSLFHCCPVADLCQQGSNEIHGRENLENLDHSIINNSKHSQEVCCMNVNNHVASETVKDCYLVALWIVMGPSYWLVLPLPPTTINLSLFLTFHCVPTWTVLKGWGWWFS